MSPAKVPVDLFSLLRSHFPHASRIGEQTHFSGTYTILVSGYADLVACRRRSNLTDATDMDDPHQVNTLIAAVISEFFKGRAEVQVGTEEVKILAKQIVKALNEAGMQIVAGREAARDS